MIYTITLNPALDKTVEIPGMALDTVNRITEMRTDPGGKGINVSKVLKALGTGFKGIGRKDVSVTAGQNGRPAVLLVGRAKELAEERGIVEFALSLSATGDLAIANAMALTEETRPKAKQTAQDEKQRIAQSFREARSVLDELERVQSGDEALENEER